MKYILFAVKSLVYVSLSITGGNQLYYVHIEKPAQEEKIEQQSKTIDLLKDQVMAEAVAIDTLSKELAVKPDTIVKEVIKEVKADTVYKDRVKYIIDTVPVHPMDTYALIHDYFAKKTLHIQAVKISKDKVKE